MEHELMVMLASAMSKEQIIERIEESIAEYKEAQLLGNEEDIYLKSHFVGLSCSLFLMNMTTDGSTDGALKVINKISQMRKRDDLFNVDKNKN